MFRKSTLLAFAASVALGLATLAPTSASAFGGHGGGFHGGGFHRGGHVGGRHFGGFRGGHVRVGHFRRHHRWHGHRHYVRWHRPLLYSTPVVYGVARTPVAGPCTCLSKEYTPEGAVLFKDRCTNEMAMNPPQAEPGPAAEVAPQLQPQTAYVPQYPPQAK